MYATKATPRLKEADRREGGTQMRSLVDRISGKSLILVGIDFSETSLSVLSSAEDLVLTPIHSELHLVHAFGSPIPACDPGGASALSELGSIEDCNAAETALEKLAGLARSRPRRVTVHARVGSAVTVIADVANDIGADLIVVGRRDRMGMRRLLLRSVAEKLVRVAPCPVLTVRSKAVPSSEQMAPLCPSCRIIRRLTGGARLWCDHHSQRHPRAHTHHKGGTSYGMGAQTFRI